MTDDSNVPAVREQREVALADTDSWVDVVRSVSLLAQQIADTEFVPRGLRGSAPATTAAILYGREVGLPPMTALTMTHVVEGRPSISAEGMRALVYAAGHELEFVETNGALCTMRARRRGADRWTDLTWTLDMARAAGLLNKHNWKAYPRDMLIARCTGALCRMVFPDVIHGFQTIEEVQDTVEPGDLEGEAPAAQGSSRVARKAVARKRTTAGKSAPPALEAGPRPTTPAGPPLPGEAGYDSTETPPGETGAAAPPAAAGETSPGGHQPESDDTGRDSTPAGELEGEGEGAGADAGMGEAPAPDQVAEAEQPRDPNDGKPITRAQQRALMAQFNGFGLTDDSDRDERLNIVSTVVEREVDSTNRLTKAEASTLIDTLARCSDRAALYSLLDTIDRAKAEQSAAEQGEG